MPRDNSNENIRRMWELYKDMSDYDKVMFEAEARMSQEQLFNLEKVIVYIYEHCDRYTLLDFYNYNICDQYE